MLLNDYFLSKQIEVGLFSFPLCSFLLQAKLEPCLPQNLRQQLSAMPNRHTGQDSLPVYDIPVGPQVLSACDGPLIQHFMFDHSADNLLEPGVDMPTPNYFSLLALTTSEWLKHLNQNAPHLQIAF